MELWIYFMEVDAKCYILWRLTWNKTKFVNKLSRVRRMNWKYSLKLTCLRCANCHELDISRLIDNSPCHLKLKWGWQGRTREEGISMSSKAEIYPLFQCDCLVISQAKDSVPQLLYLSRCDVQSVKFAARKALSSLGMICETYGLYPWFFLRLKKHPDLADFPSRL